ncbi:MAG: acyltransferase [Eubacteriales bacterium]|nr:acyltransferase [Eubacteriales bacterium]
MKTEATLGQRGTSFISIMRVIAAFAVVVIHSRSFVDYDSKIYDFIHICVLWSVPLFFMITGYIYLGIKKEVSYDSIKKNVFRLLILLFTMGVFYALLERVFVEKTINANILLYSIGDVFQGNTWDHLWYMYSIIGIYLVLPMFSAFVQKDGKNIYIILFLLGLFRIVVPEICEIANVSCGFSLPIGEYCFYVFAGGAMYRLGENRAKKLFVPSCVALASVILIIAVCMFTFDITITKDYCYSYVAIMTILLFIILMSLKVKENNFIKSVSECSLGIYLIHPFFIHLLVKLFDIRLVGTAQVVSFPLACIGIFALSYVSTLVLKKYVKII